MAFIAAEVLVEVSPDTSKFNAQLKRQLEDSIRRVEASAATTLNLKVNIDDSSAKAGKAIEKGFSGVEDAFIAINKLSDQLSVQFKEINNTLKASTQAIASVAKTLTELTRSSEQSAKKISLLGRAFETLGSLARFAASVTTVISNIVTISQFGKSLGSLVSNFKANAEAAKGFRENIKALGKSLTQTFVPLEKQQEVVEKIGKAIINTAKATEGLSKGFGKVSDGVSKAGTATKAAVTNFVGSKKAVDDVSKSLATQNTALSQTATQVAKTNPILRRFRDETGALNLGFLSGKKAAGEFKFGFDQINVAANQALRTTRTTTSIFDKLKSGLSSVGTQAKTAATGVKEFGTGISSAVFGAVSGVFEGIVSGASAAGRAVLAAGANAITASAKFATLNVAKGAILGLASAAQQLVGAIVGILGPAGLAAVAVAGIGFVAVGASKKIIALAQAASALQESNNAINVLLGKSSEKFRTLIGDSSKLGISTRDLNQALTPIIPLLKNSGLQGDAFAKKLNEITRRAVDISSIMNVEVSQALGAMGAGLRGEIDPLERLGVSFTAVEVEAKAAALGFKRVNGEFDTSAKTLARLEVILEKSKITAGDFANTSTSLANAQRVLKGSINNVKDAMSKAFLPGAEAITAALIKFVNAAGPGLIKFFESLTPVITELSKVFVAMLPAITESIGVFQLSIPVITQFLKVVAQLIPILRVLLTAFVISKTLTTTIFLFVKLSSVLTGLAAKFLGAGKAASIASTGFLGAAKAAQTTAVSMQTSSIVAAASSSKFAFLGKTFTSVAGAAKGLGTSILAALGPVGVAVVALTVIQSLDAALVNVDELMKELRTSTAAAGEQFAQFTAEASLIQNIFGPLSGIVKTLGGTGIQTLELARSVSAFQEQVNIALDASDEVALKVLTTIAQGAKGTELFDQFNTIIKEANEIQAERTKELKETAAAARQALTTEEEYAKMLQETTSKISGLIGASSSLKSANKSLESAQKGVTDAQKAVVDAQKGVTDAQTNASKSTENVTKLEQERAQILRNTISPLEEVAAAERQLTQIRNQLRDLSQDQVATERELAELRDPSTIQDQIAASDRSIERAKIALARAIRDENEAQQELTATLEDANDVQQVSIDLTGLSVDQIRTRLANIRETLKLQKAVAKATSTSTTGEAKTQVEIDEDKLTKRLDVLDAEQNLKDIVESRQTIELTHAETVREAEEKLEELAISKVELEIQQVGAQKAINLLRQGETTLASTIKAIDEQIVQAKLAQKDAVGQIKVAQDGVTAAVTAQKDAQQLVTDALLAQKIAQQELKAAQAGLTSSAFAQLEAEREILRLKGDQAGLTAEDNRLLGEKLSIFDQYKKALQDTEKAAGSLSIAEAGTFFPSFPGQPAFQPTTASGSLLLAGIGAGVTAGTNAASKALIDAAVGIQAIVGAISTIAQKTGVQIPGLAEGAVFHNAGPAGQMVRIAEAGAEAAIPLTKPARALQLLRASIPYASPGLRGALQRITLPGLAQGGIANSVRIGGGSNSSSSRSSAFADQAASRKNNEELAGLIAKNLAALVDGSKTEVGGIHVNVSNPDPERTAWLAAKAIERKLNRIG